MRVTHTATYRKFNSSINSVHSKLNRSMDKVSSGRAYESAAENPLAYYEGKKMDNQYQDVETKLELISDVKNRLYQQEAGARSIQSTLFKSYQKVEYIRNDTNNGNLSTVEVVENDLLQKMHSMVNDLNAQYQDFFVYGGNDLSTAPFTLSDDGTVLTYNHIYPDNPDKLETITLTLTADGNGGYYYDVSDLGLLEKAMKEQGRIDIGYGTIRDRSTLLDTYTGGFNLLTGITSDAMRNGYDQGELQKRINDSPLGLLGQAIGTMRDYRNGGEKEIFSDNLGTIMDKMTQTEQNVATVYSDLGNKYSLLETTEEKLNIVSDQLKEQYSEKLGADPYEAVTEMYSYQYSYNASLQLGSSLMQSSLFDFMR